MSEQKLESLAKFELTEDNRLQVSGELSFKNVPELILMSQDYFNNSDGLDVDLADVSRADSAGVALLIEWQRLAQMQKKSISFFNVPSQMMAIARLSGVDELLFLKN
jgi:phospholipid transport system transporter-binding protein